MRLDRGGVPRLITLLGTTRVSGLGKVRNNTSRAGPLQKERRSNVQPLAFNACNKVTDDERSL